MSTTFTETAGIPARESSPVFTYRSVVLDVPGRPVPLELAVSFPPTGDELPVILLSHGHGSANFLNSNRGYEPLASFWAAQGFAVIRPTHLDAMEYGLRESGHPDAPLFWRTRAQDLRFTLDHLADVEASVPGLAGRLDHSKIAAVGHSLGGHSVEMLLGMRDVEPGDEGETDCRDPRVKVGVLIGAPGIADEFSGRVVTDLYPVLKYIDFSGMDTPTLIVHGSEDVNPGFSTRHDYRADAYWHSTAGNKTLLTVTGAEHLFGGIAGYDVGETTDENPERVAVVRALIAAYLRTQLYPGDTSWHSAQVALEAQSTPTGTIETR